MLIHETQTAGKARPFAFSLLDGQARTHLHKRWPNLGRRTIPPNSLIHESAYQRGGDYARHLPPMRSQQAEQGFFGGSRHRRDVSCNVSALTRLPWPCALLLARKLAALAIGSFPRGKHARRRP